MANREEQMIVVSRKADGTPDIWCDPEIADLVTAINKGGLRTVASCSGHGHRPGTIALQDGRELLILANYVEARKAEAFWPNNTNGDALQSLTDSGTTEWYKCSDAVPPISEAPYYVLVSNGYHIGVGYRSERYDDDPSSPEWCEEGGDYIEPTPTHWAYLPKPPSFATPTPQGEIAEPGEDYVKSAWLARLNRVCELANVQTQANGKQTYQFSAITWQAFERDLRSYLSALEPSPLRADGLDTCGLEAAYAAVDALPLRDFEHIGGELDKLRSHEGARAAISAYLRRFPLEPVPGDSETPK
jgi:hypothetical protein